MRLGQAWGQGFNGPSQTLGLADEVPSANPRGLPIDEAEAARRTQYSNYITTNRDMTVCWDCAISTLHPNWSPQTISPSRTDEQLLGLGFTHLIVKPSETPPPGVLVVWYADGVEGMPYGQALHAVVSDSSGLPLSTNLVLTGQLENLSYAEITNILTSQFARHANPPVIRIEYYQPPNQ
jgi:hypothetical protein